MPPEEAVSELAREWLASARDDLTMAGYREDLQVSLAPLCFHAQQAAEKALKALLVLAQVEFPFTHDLRRLMGLLPAEAEVPAELREAAILSDYASWTRYPGQRPLVDEGEYRTAYALAEQTVVWAAQWLEEHLSG